ncbi:hypothetical protein [Nocardia sp. NPDC047038]|uniref:hypothetical protein n=1 Tax=Nocardia sp. NPDC047038 TaxID=3154338 RepID=UPI0033FACD64
MGESRVVRPLRAGMRLDAAIEAYLHTVTAANTRRGYRTALTALVSEFGADCIRRCWIRTGSRPGSAPAGGGVGADVQRAPGRAARRV